jgi:uncharacterized protein
MATARPVRAMDPYAEQFWAFTRDRELRLQQCSACGKFRWPPGPTCDRCLSDDFAWSVLSGVATVLSWTTFRRGYFPEYPPPHTVVALELAEGPLFIAYPVGLEPMSCGRAWRWRFGGRTPPTGSASTTCRSSARPPCAAEARPR